MSAKHVVQQIDRFLASEEPEVLCITGKWGVGKTFSWNYYLRGRQKAGGISLPRYSYVSLFGKNSLEDVRRSIFEETEGTKSAEQGPLADAKTAVGRAVRRASQAATQLPGVGDWAAVADRFYFLAVRRQIVCIDDLERAGTDLSAKDVLGLASFLKEQRACKIVLLLNHEELEEDDRETYDSQLEKVADTVLAFEPRPEEAAAIGISPDTPLAEVLKRSCIKLGIVNIRVIKKIERFAKRAQEIIVDFDPAVREQAVYSIALFGWSVFQPDKAPPLELLKNSRRLHGLIDRPKGELDPDGPWRALLQEYGYTHTDDFDLVLLSALENGYFDHAATRDAASDVQKRLRAANRENSFDAAWDRYHASLEDNQEEVLDGLYQSLKASVEFVSPGNLSGTVETLRELGRSAQADELVQFYVEARGENRNLFDLAAYSFKDHVRDQGVIDAFRVKYESFQDTRNPIEELRKIGEQKSWNSGDIALIAKLSPDDLYEAFKAARGEELRKLIQSALFFERVAGASDEMNKITSGARAALERIGRESPLNARRVRIYGVVVT